MDPKRLSCRLRSISPCAQPSENDVFTFRTIALDLRTSSSSGGETVGLWKMRPNALNLKIGMSESPPKMRWTRSRQSLTVVSSKSSTISPSYCVEVADFLGDWLSSTSYFESTMQTW